MRKNWKRFCQNKFLTIGTANRIAAYFGIFPSRQLNVVQTFTNTYRKYLMSVPLDILDRDSN